MTFRTTVAFVVLGCLLATLAGANTERAKTAPIAVIVSGPGAVPAAFRQNLAILGYSEGQNLQVDERWLPTLTDPLLDLVDELSQMRPDVVVRWGDRATQGARYATRRIPIIFVVAADPVANMFVGSLVRPEGNMTGITLNSAEASRRRIELLQATMPGLSRLGVISRPENPGAAHHHRRPDGGAIAGRRDRDGTGTATPRIRRSPPKARGPSRRSGAGALVVRFSF